MELAIVKSDVMEDWYLIERDEHDGRTWMEQTGPNSMAFRTSARFSDADVEGTSYEMIGMADAIERRGERSYKRCAVDATSESVTFRSPRNSSHDGVCSREEADRLAGKIRALLAGGP